MFLKELKVKNFRSFSKNKNTLELVSSSQKSIVKTEEDMKKKISESTTLIVGKNNTGKTTTIKALSKFIKREIMTIYDFNISYLKELFEQEEIEIPKIEVELTIILDRDILLNKISNFATLEDIENKEIKIYMSYETKNESLYKENYKKLQSSSFREKQIFLKEELKTYEYVVRNKEFKIINKKVSDLIELEVVNANHKIDDEILKKSFNKIFKSRLKNHHNLEEGLIEDVININGNLTDKLKEIHEEGLNGENLTDEIVNFEMESNLTVDSLLEKNFSFFYKDNGRIIPENQYGLGYTNLMCIISRLIEYAESYRLEKKMNKIRILSIEEPEAYMHPQLQEEFMEKISKILFNIVGQGNELNPFQIMITTHSSHVLKSKLKIGNSFNNINYFSNYKDGNTKIIKLCDEEIEKEENITKYIAVKVNLDFSDLFFADGIIAVEGNAEEIILPAYLMKKIATKKRISVFNVRGAHADKFYGLFKLLEIPTLIITDLDIQRETIDKKDTEKEKEAKKFKNIDDLSKRKTTNNIIKGLLENPKINLEDLAKPGNQNRLKSGKIVIATQIEKIEGYYSTSLEEALVLSNLENEEFKEILKKHHPKTYEIISNNIKENSYKIQKKYSDKKTEIANDIKDMILEEKEIEIPSYIKDGIKKLKVLMGE